MKSADCSFFQSQFQTHIQLIRLVMVPVHPVRCIVVEKEKVNVSVLLHEGQGHFLELVDQLRLGFKMVLSKLIKLNCCSYTHAHLLYKI